MNIVSIIRYVVARHSQMEQTGYSIVYISHLCSYPYGSSIFSRGGL